MRIRFGIPFYQEFEWVKPLLQELEKSDKHQFDIVKVLGSDIARAKNSFFTDDGTKILDYDFFIIHDSDQRGLLHEDICRMIDYDKPVIGVPVLMQNGDEYVCGMFDSIGKVGKRFKPSDGLKGLQPLDYTGDGLIIIRRDVLVKYVEKYKTFDFFRTYPYKDGDCYRHPSWDIGFCAYLQALKIKVYCDFDVKVEHRLRNPDDINWDIYNIQEAGLVNAKSTLIDTNKIYDLNLSGTEVAVIVDYLKKGAYDIVEPIITKIVLQMAEQKKKKAA